MSGKAASALAILLFLLSIAGATKTTSTNQNKPANQDTRKKAGFDPTQFEGEDLTPLLSGQKFSDGRHLLKPFADGTKLSITTKDGKIRRATLIDWDGSRSDATIHSPTDTATVRKFTIGVSIKTPHGETCFICTFGRDKSSEARSRQRLIRCDRAPCDDFYPEPEPPTIDPLKKAK